MNQKNRTLRRLGIAGVATAMATVGTPALASAATIAPHTVKADAISAPSAPTGLKATDAGSGMVNLSWKAPSGAVSGYNVYFSTASGQESGTTPANKNVLVKGTSYTVTVPNSGTFYFQVAAVNAAGEGPLSSEASSAAAAVAPGAPTGVTATASPNAVNISWKAPATGGTPNSYTVNYGTSSSSLTSQRTVSGSTTSVLINNLSNGTAYYFDVAANNAAGSGTASGTVSATPASTDAPSAPTSLVASPDGSGKIKLTWTGTSPNATTYNVYEGTTSGGESSTPINGSVPVSGSSLTVTATNGTTEYFTVKAVNANGVSPASNEAHATAAAAAASVGANPSAPQNLSSSVVGPQAVKLAWKAPSYSGSSTVQKYFVMEEDTTAATPSFTKATLSSSTTTGHNSTTGTSAVVTGLVTGDKYVFEVYAENAASTNGTALPASKASTASTSATTSASSRVVPQAPSITSVSTVNTGAVTSGNPESNTIKWSAPAYPTTGLHYLVYRNGTEVGNTTSTHFVDQGYSASNTRGALSTDSAPAAGTTYSYKVTAATSTSGTATSGVAKIDTGNPMPGSPTSLVATASTTKKSVNLTWMPPTDMGAGNVTYDVLENGKVVKTTAGTAGAAGSLSTTATTSSSTALTSFTVEAQATNGTGTDLGAPSAPSNASSVVASAQTAAPAAPTGLTAAGINSSSVKLQWNASSTAGNIAPTNYTILENATGSTAADFAGVSATSTKIGTSTSYTATGLKSGTKYYFEVEASNTAGTSTSNPTASATTTATTVSTAPGVPTGLKASVSGGLVDLSWTAPTNTGGSAISGYQIFDNTSSSTAGATKVGSTSGTGTSAVLDNLGTSTIDLFVKAMNSSGGTSGFSQPVQVTPSTSSARPSAPSTPQVTAESGGRAVVVWTPPANAGGSAITGYFVTAHLVGGKGKTVFVHGTSAVVGGLSTGTYYFTVVATNVVGGGTPSAPSSFVKITSTGPQGNIKVYVTPPKMIPKAGVTTIRVTTNKPGVQVHLFDEAFGTSHFFQKKIMTTTRQANGTGVAIFKIGIARANHFFVIADGVKSNTVIARVK